MLPVVVVDDSHSDLFFCQRELWAARILNPVLLFPSAKTCLEYFQRESFPCLGLVDLVLSPDRGANLIKKLRAIPLLQNSVFVMLSAMSDYKLIAEGYAAGAATFLTKPVSHDELVRIFRNVRGLSVLQHRNGNELTLSARLDAHAPVHARVSV
ncbi:MAG TPA: response regulator [Verrucomicrobiae bacterium]